MISEGELVFIWNPQKGDSFLFKLKSGQTQGTHFGQIKHDDIMQHNFGDGVRMPKGAVYYIMRPTIGEYTRRLKRQTQIVFPKDSAYIIEHLNIFPGCTVVECGTGSGSLCCTFAHFVGANGRVCTYDRREEFSALARKNAERWGVADRIEFNVRELEEGFKERDADAVFLDVPTPWLYIDKAYEALAPGNHLGILVPTANQISETLRALAEHNFCDVQVLEIMHRFYKTEPNRIRPEDMMIGHTGYLIFAAKTLPIAEITDEEAAQREYTDHECVGEVQNESA
ncbi:MAG: tRNA (adenine-N1)-methyltransferase [Synergistes sp.]|nr:tRNA (adenine-N1)-methyltransferase [Synergistes sp.]